MPTELPPVLGPDELPIPFGIEADDRRAASGHDRGGSRAHRSGSQGGPRARRTAGPTSTWRSPTSTRTTSRRPAGACVFAKDADPAIKKALEPLLAHREAQAKRLFKVFEGNSGLSARATTRGNGSSARAPGSRSVDPEHGVPVYVLLVGSPEEIPFEFQYLAGPLLERRPPALRHARRVPDLRRERRRLRDRRDAAAQEARGDLHREERRRPRHRASAQPGRVAASSPAHRRSDARGLQGVPADAAARRGRHQGAADEAACPARGGRAARVSLHRLARREVQDGRPGAARQAGRAAVPGLARVRGRGARASVHRRRHPGRCQGPRPDPFLLRLLRRRLPERGQLRTRHRPAAQAADEAAHRGAAAAAAADERGAGLARPRRSRLGLFLPERPRRAAGAGDARRDGADPPGPARRARPPTASTCAGRCCRRSCRSRRTCANRSAIRWCRTRSSPTAGWPATTRATTSSSATLPSASAPRR